MTKKNLRFSAFSLAKGKELVGEDFYDVKLFDDVLVAVVCDGVEVPKKGQMPQKEP